MKISVAMHIDDINRMEQLNSISKDSRLRVEDRERATIAAEGIYNCAIAAKVVADFNMWRGDPHFDEHDINEWLEANRREADQLILIHRGPKMMVKFLYHNSEVYRVSVRGKDRQDCIEQAMNAFNIAVGQNEPQFDTITTYPTSSPS